MLPAIFLFIMLFIPFWSNTAPQIMVTRIYWVDRSSATHALDPIVLVCNDNALSTIHSRLESQTQNTSFQSSKPRRIFVRDLEKEKRRTERSRKNKETANTIIIGGLMGMSAFAIYALSTMKY